MTAKEKLMERVVSLSEEDASIALNVVERELDDPVVAAFREAPEDDEPWTEEDEVAVAEVEEDRRQGIGATPLETIERKLGGE